MTWHCLHVVVILCFAVAGAQRGDGGSERDDGGSTCVEGYWGDQCRNVCGYCDMKRKINGPYDRECNPVTGVCKVGCQVRIFSLTEADYTRGRR